jgi:hypothetical protein
MTSAPAAAKTTQPAKSVTQKPVFKAGIAVGVILLALGIAAFCLWLLWYRRRRQHERANIPAISEADSDIYSPDPASAVPGPILRSNPDADEYPGNTGRGNEVSRLSPISDSGWTGGFKAGFVGRSMDERIRPVVDPYRMPYEGT